MYAVNIDTSDLVSGLTLAGSIFLSAFILSSFCQEVNSYQNWSKTEMSSADFVLIETKATKSL